MSSPRTRGSIRCKYWLDSHFRGNDNSGSISFHIVWIPSEQITQISQIVCPAGNNRATSLLPYFSLTRVFQSNHKTESPAKRRRALVFLSAHAYHLIDNNSTSKMSIAFGPIRLSCAPLAVRKVRRNKQLPLRADFHVLQRLGPSRDNTAYGKARRFTALI